MKMFFKHSLLSLLVLTCTSMSFYSCVNAEREATREDVFEVFKPAAIAAGTGLSLVAIRSLIKWRLGKQEREQERARLMRSGEARYKTLEKRRKILGGMTSYLSGAAKVALAAALVLVPVGLVRLELKTRTCSSSEVEEEVASVDYTPAYYKDSSLFKYSYLDDPQDPESTVEGNWLDLSQEQRKLVAEKTFATREIAPLPLNIVDRKQWELEAWNIDRRIKSVENLLTAKHKEKVEEVFDDTIGDWVKEVTPFDRNKFDKEQKPKLLKRIKKMKEMSAAIRQLVTDVFD